ncbi:MAG: hypothetical protein J7L72_01470 [Candidatus Aminicenantes bacterium]|nr:hypothetical protein [Candidatus Aminicenantes bacterium]
MKDNNSYWILKIRKRPFYIWLLRFLWIVWLVFWAEAALGSKAELEPRALVISLIIFLVSLLTGLALWLLGIKRFKK